MNFISDLWGSLCRLFSGGGSAGDNSAGGHRLYVGNLSYRVKEEELRSLFAALKGVFRQLLGSRLKKLPRL